MTSPMTSPTTSPMTSPTAATTPRSHYVTLCGREVHYMEWGTRGQPPLILWHGVARTGRDFDDLALALADARSLSFDDFIISERRYPNRVGQTYAVKYNPDHKWFYFPHMRREEAVVFKVFDSLKDGRARWTAHTAFDDPTSRPNAPPRESIEIRTLAFF